MDSSVISPSVALAGVLSGALMILFSAALIHLLLLRRRRAKLQARAAGRLIALDGNNHGTTSSSQSDSDLGSLEAVAGEEEKGSRLSLNLTPNQPIFVDVEAVYAGAGGGSGGYGGGGGGTRGGGGGAQAGLQLILTPPTPRRVIREIP